MLHPGESLFEYTVEELDRELLARGARVDAENRFKFKDKEGTPERDAIMAQVKKLYDSNETLSLNEDLHHISTWELTKILMYKTGKIEINGARGTWGTDERMDFYEITDNQIKKNAACTAAICKKDSLLTNKKGFSTLKVKNYGKTFNLCDCEPFQQQSIFAGPMCTGFLVKEDMIVTAAHFVNEKNVIDLRIVFGFKMMDATSAVIQVPNKNIYQGVKLLNRVYKRMDTGGSGSDWALVKLDRKVVGQSVATLSTKGLSCGQGVYVIGHPVGLPLKYAPGAHIMDISGAYFPADLDVYSGNSGSPVFDSDTHELLGMVVRGDNRDFRWTGNGWLSVIYPNRDTYSTGAQCTRVSEFSEYCR